MLFSAALCKIWVEEAVESRTASVSHALYYLSKPSCLHHPYLGQDVQSKYIVQDKSATEMHKHTYAKSLAPGALLDGQGAFARAATLNCPVRTCFISLYAQLVLFYSREHQQNVETESQWHIRLDLEGISSQFHLAPASSLRLAVLT